MSKIAEKFVLAIALAAMAGGSALAVEANCVRLSFKPVAGTYLDGTTDASAEWYAVCGSKDAVFAGITADCKAVDPVDDKIYGCLKANNLGRITCTFDQDGRSHFFVFLLDTRGATGAASAAYPTVVNGVKEVVDVESSAVASLAFADATANAFGFSAIPSDLTTEARIAGIDASSDPENIIITVEGVHKALQYNVRTDSDAGKVAEGGLADTPKTSETGTVQFTVPKTGDRAQFFRLVRQPLDNK